MYTYIHISSNCYETDKYYCLHVFVCERGCLCACVRMSACTCYFVFSHFSRWLLQTTSLVALLLQVLTKELHHSFERR